MKAKAKYLAIDPMDRTSRIFRLLAEQIARTKAILTRLETIQRMGSYKTIRIPKTTIKRHTRKAHTRTIFSV